jgi:hypothetical protein
MTVAASSCFMTASPSLRSLCAAVGLAAVGFTLTAPARAQDAGEPAAEAAPLPPRSNLVWEHELRSFDQSGYAEAVEGALAAFEQQLGRRLTPGPLGRVGLKVYAESGPGLSTPPSLVRAVAQALERRGFPRSGIFIVGQSETRLRSAGLLPPLSVGGSRFGDIEVKALDSGRFFDPEWHYDSPLQARMNQGMAERADPEEEARGSRDRLSLLPMPLIHEADFWVNLPVVTDHPALGINGALVNGTLGNASNTLRFLRSPATGPAAVAEMAAIPELRAGWVLNILSLERYQFIGGPIFNSLYTRSEPRLWLSDNPALLDALIRKRIDRAREEIGFRPLPSDLRLLAYAEQMGLGPAEAERARIITLP